jgi:XRE family transcriptional regulator, fatty acid utilization regulator
MSQASLGQRWERRGEQEINDWLNATASEFQVTAVALYWRLRHLGWLTSAASLEVDTHRLTWNGLSPSAQTLPKLYSSRFVERLRVALEKGDLSVRRAAGLLDCTIEDLEDLFKSYGMEVPFEL